jgi:hypothetical protein
MRMQIRMATTSCKSGCRCSARPNQGVHLAVSFYFSKCIHQTQSNHAGVTNIHVSDESHINESLMIMNASLIESLYKKNRHAEK